MDSAKFVDPGVSRSVRKKPGSTSIVRIPNGSTSTASDRQHRAGPSASAATSPGSPRASWTPSPALLHTGRLDILAANPLARALFAPIFDHPGPPANFARFAFLDPRAHDFWIDWDRAADDSVAVLRTTAVRDPDDKALSDLVGELSARSEAFHIRWAATHDTATPPTRP